MAEIKPSKQVGVKVPIELSERLTKIAQRERNGVSAVCRRLLSEALQREELAIAGTERRAS